MTTKYKSSKEVPTDALLNRAEELADAVTRGSSGSYEFTMRVPAECDRDADLVICELVKRFKAQQARITELEAQLKEREWISVDERLPEIDYSGSQYSHYIDVICANDKSVRQLRYISNAYAKTEKGREPRFEELTGRLTYMNPTHWMPLPQPPKDNKHE